MYIGAAPEKGAPGLARRRNGRFRPRGRVPGPWFLSFTILHLQGSGRPHRGLRRLSLCCESHLKSKQLQNGQSGRLWLKLGHPSSNTHLLAFSLRHLLDLGILPHLPGAQPSFTHCPELLAPMIIDRPTSEHDRYRFISPFQLTLGS